MSRVSQLSKIVALVERAENGISYSGETGAVRLVFQF